VAGRFDETELDGRGRAIVDVNAFFDGPKAPPAGASQDPGPHTTP
jgi:hypothetical protein